MRPLKVQLDEGKGREVLKIASELKAKNISLVKGFNDERQLDLISLTLSNRRVEEFIEKISEIDGAEITLFPHGVMAMYPPAGEAPDQVKDVQLRSPIEILLSGLQSIGSWKGFIAYTIISAIVVWIGLYTNTSYLLVAAMLIAPFAGPAMNTAIATARGDLNLLRHGLLRYFSSLLVMIVTTALISFLFQQEVATGLMVDRSQISSVVLLLSLAAGAAGAVNLIQSERDSLVSGAAVGMLVAASLAPPAGITGMAIAIGEWEMVKSGVFLLLLQLLGINLAGSVVFKFAGLSTGGIRYGRGRKYIRSLSLVVTTILLAVIIFWQFNSVPEMQRSSVSKRIEAIIQKTIDADDRVELVEANARFTRAEIKDQNTVLCVIYLQKENTDNEELIKAQLKKKLSSNIKEDYKDVTPVISVILLEPQE